MNGDTKGDLLAHTKIFPGFKNSPLFAQVLDDNGFDFIIYDQPGGDEAGVPALYFML